MTGLRVFISHSHKDKDWSRVILNTLQFQKNSSVFWNCLEPDEEIIRLRIPPKNTPPKLVLSPYPIPPFEEEDEEENEDSNNDLESRISTRFWNNLVVRFLSDPTWTGAESKKQESAVVGVKQLIRTIIRAELDAEGDLLASGLLQPKPELLRSLQTILATWPQARSLRMTDSLLKRSILDEQFTQLVSSERDVYRDTDVGARLANDQNYLLLFLDGGSDSGGNSTGDSGSTDFAYDSSGSNSLALRDFREFELSLRFGLRLPTDLADYGHERGPFGRLILSERSVGAWARLANNQNCLLLILDRGSDSGGNSTGDSGSTDFAYDSSDDNSLVLRDFREFELAELLSLILEGGGGSRDGKFELSILQKDKQRMVNNTYIRLPNSKLVSVSEKSINLTPTVH